MADNDREPAKQRPTRDALERERSRAVPPMPKGSRHEGVPDRGPPPHGQEPARPKDTGRHGA